MSCAAGVVSPGMTALLTDKNAIVHGAAGSLGSAVARTFAADGARVFVAGRTREPLERLAAEIGAEATVLDALDAAAVAERGGIDVSFNLVPRGDVQGTPLVERRGRVPGLRRRRRHHRHDRQRDLRPRPRLI
jgi:NAD(P)-dependent dehydrogenase (short-subunit alcohol dehydrogenase family)